MHMVDHGRPWKALVDHDGPLNVVIIIFQLALVI